MNKTVTLDLNEQAILRMALNDRIRWLTVTLGINESDYLITQCRDLLAKLDALPIGI